MKTNEFLKYIRTFFFVLMLFVPFNSVIGLTGSIESVLVVKINSKRNSITVDRQRVQVLRMIELIPTSGIDFRKHDSLFMLIEKDGVIELDIPLAEYVDIEDRTKKNKVTVREEFSDFDKLIITIYDVNNTLKFEMDAYIYVSGYMEN